MIQRVFIFFDKLGNKKLFIVLYVFLLFLAILFSYIGEYFDYNLGIDEPMELEKEGLVKMIGYGVIIAPFLETYLFTYLPYKAVSHFTQNINIFIIVASLLFGIEHVYSLMYIIFGIISGIILNLYYIFLLKKQKNAFMGVVLLHASLNFTLIMIEEIFK